MLKLTNSQSVKKKKRSKEENAAIWAQAKEKIEIKVYEACLVEYDRIAAEEITPIMCVGDESVINFLHCIRSYP